MLSNKQYMANLLDAQMSTGPQSDANKRKVSLNSLVHGFAGDEGFVEVGFFGRED